MATDAAVLDDGNGCGGAQRRPWMTWRCSAMTGTAGRGRVLDALDGREQSLLWSTDREFLSCLPKNNWQTPRKLSQTPGTQIGRKGKSARAQAARRKMSKKLQTCRLAARRKNFGHPISLKAPSQPDIDFAKTISVNFGSLEKLWYPMTTMRIHHYFFVSQI